MPDIRPETAKDRAAIRALTERAFANVTYSDGDEPDLIDRLRDAGRLAMSLIAERDGEIAGHIAFSPAIAADGSQGWYALGPVSVEPRLQNRGIGAALIEAGLSQLRGINANGCVLIGSRYYYPRFGFTPRPDLCPAGQPAEHYMVIAFGTDAADMVVDFDPLFSAQ